MTLESRLRDQTGSAAAELVIVAPVLLAFLLVFAFGGQLFLAQQEVRDIARTAAEAATDATNPAAAQYIAETSAAGNAMGDGLRCLRLVTVTDTTDFLPGGQLSVTVTCDASMPPLSLFHLPSAFSLVASSHATIEPYRAVGP
jgi:Flp pilus assembly protein TadG